MYIYTASVGWFQYSYFRAKVHTFVGTWTLRVSAEAEDLNDFLIRRFCLGFCGFRVESGAAGFSLGCIESCPWVTQQTTLVLLSGSQVLKPLSWSERNYEIRAPGLKLTKTLRCEGLL